MCFDFFNIFVLNISHSNKNCEILSKTYIGLHIKYQLFLSNFNYTRIFSTYFRKMVNFMEIRPVGAKFFHADRLTDGLTWRS